MRTQSRDWQNWPGSRDSGSWDCKICNPYCQNIQTVVAFVIQHWHYLEVYAVYNVLRETAGLGKTETNELLITGIYLSVSKQCQQKTRKFEHSLTHRTCIITSTTVMLPLFCREVGHLNTFICIYAVCWNAFWLILKWLISVKLILKLIVKRFSILILYTYRNDRVKN